MCVFSLPPPSPPPPPPEPESDPPHFQAPAGTGAAAVPKRPSAAHGEDGLEPGSQAPLKPFPAQSPGLGQDQHRPRGAPGGCHLSFQFFKVAFPGAAGAVLGGAAEQLLTFGIPEARPVSGNAGAVVWQAARMTFL